MRDNSLLEAALKLISAFEGFSSAPYRCPAGVPTIGYGSTYDLSGNRVTMEHAPLSRDEAYSWLAHEAFETEKGLRRLCSVNLNYHQLNALVSFAYNVGTGAFQHSTMRQKLNRGDYDGAAREFPRWRFAGGRVLPGLIRRRQAEQELFRGGG